MPYEAAAPRLAAMGAPGGAAFWDGVKGNLTLFDDAKDILRLIEGPYRPSLRLMMPIMWRQLWTPCRKAI